MHEASLFYGAFNRGFALWAKDFVRTYRVTLWRVLDYSRGIKKRYTRYLFFMSLLYEIAALHFYKLQSVCEQKTMFFTQR